MSLCIAWYHGRLFESGDAERGERFFSNAPGVYVHKDETCAKTGNCPESFDTDAYYFWLPTNL